MKLSGRQQDSYITKDDKKISSPYKKAEFKCKKI